MPPKPWRREDAGDSAPSGGAAAAAGQAGGGPGAWPQVRELEDETPVLREGGEEAAYIYLDLTDVPSGVALEGAVPEAFDTAAPRLRLADGRVLEGAYADSLGSQLFFAAAPAEEGPAANGGGLRLVGLSERTVRFKLKQQAAN